MLLAVLHETLLCKSFWENQHSSGCSFCGSLIAPSWAVGPSDASQTVSQPANKNTFVNIIEDEFGRVTAVQALATQFASVHSQGKPHLVLALAKKPQLTLPPALLRLQRQDFILKGFFSGTGLVFHPVDLGKGWIRSANDQTKFIRLQKRNNQGCVLSSSFAVPAAWRLLEPPPAVCWKPGTPSSADPTAGYCRQQLPPDLRATAPAPGSPVADFLTACTQTHREITALKTPVSRICNKKTNFRHKMSWCLTCGESLQFLVALNWPPARTPLAPLTISANFAGFPSTKMKLLLWLQ